MMNRKSLVIAFGIGVLLCGLGSGIALAQYSKFEYAGEKIIGSETMKTETIEKSIDKDSDIIVSNNMGRHCKMSLVADETVPIEKIAFDATYNSEAVVFGVDEWDNSYTDSEDNTEKSEITFDFYIYLNDMEEMFMIKDELMKDLKNHKLGSYMVSGIESIIIRVNPKNSDRVIIR